MITVTRIRSNEVNDIFRIDGYDREPVYISRPRGEYSEEDIRIEFSVQ